MKKIINVDDKLKVTIQGAEAINYRRGFLECLNTCSASGQSKDPLESIKVVKLSFKLDELKSSDWHLEEAEYELLKRSIEQNNRGFTDFIIGQLLIKLQGSTELKIA